MMVRSVLGSDTTTAAPKATTEQATCAVLGTPKMSGILADMVSSNEFWHQV